MAATTHLPAGAPPVPPQLSPHASPPSSGDVKSWRVPRLLLKVKDVSHEGAIRYLETTNTHKLLTGAVVGVLSTLYTPETAPSTQRSVTLILRRMDGVAYTTGSDLDNDHKQIHMSLEYLSNIPEALIKVEIEGVVRHEMVHCWQYDGNGTAPGGLIEGVADWVRLKAGFCPPHWKRGGVKWDDGYQNTAYFLDYLCDRFGPNTVKDINLALKDKKYSPSLWLAISGGIPVETLWEQYRKAFNLPPPDKQPPPDKRPGSPGRAKYSDYLVVSNDEAAKIPAQQPLPSTTATTSAASTAAAAASGSNVSVTLSEPSASSDVWPFSGDTPLAHVMVDRLKHMTFDGTSDATRYILEFEALIDRLQPEMTDGDKKLLLCTSFQGANVVNWYETTCRAVTYAQLKEEMQESFKNY